jgi:hypothetical protein
MVIRSEKNFDQLGMQGIAPALIIIRVALGMSSTPSEGHYSAARSNSKHVPTQVRIGYSTTTYSDGGEHLAADVPVSPIKSKSDDEGLGSSSRVSSLENTSPA